MGLDMYLRGRKYLWRDWDNPDQHPTQDGFRVETIILDLGYWRKHPNLHGYIVKTFANGTDECQKIELSADNIRRIVEAVKGKSLPHTEGFFFGASDGSKEEIDEDVKIFEAALKWLEAGPEEPKLKKEVLPGATLIHFDNETEWPRESRSVIYQASW